MLVEVNDHLLLLIFLIIFRLWSRETTVLLEAEVGPST